MPNLKVQYQPCFKIPAIADAMRPYRDRIHGVHPACAGVADIDPFCFGLLVEAIQKEGLLIPILIDPAGNLVDGRCRLRACYVLGKRLTDDQIVETDISPQAIAESNIARRHLTADQHAMIAIQRLAIERKAAVKRKKLGRGDGEQQLVTGSVASSKNQRRPSTIDSVAKEQGVSRERLAKAEKLQKSSPEIAARVKQGEISLKAGLLAAGISAKRPKRRNPIGKPPKESVSRMSLATATSGPIVVGDGRTVITDRADGIRMIECRHTFIFQHEEAEEQVIACKTGQEWLVFTTGETDLSDLMSRQNVQNTAIQYIKQLIVDSQTE